MNGGQSWVNLMCGLLRLRLLNFLSLESVSGDAFESHPAQLSERTQVLASRNLDFTLDAGTSPLGPGWRGRSTRIGTNEVRSVFRLASASLLILRVLHVSPTGALVGELSPLPTHLTPVSIVNGRSYSSLVDGSRQWRKGRRHVMGKSCVCQTIKAGRDRNGWIRRRWTTLAVAVAVGWLRMVVVDVIGIVTVRLEIVNQPMIVCFMGRAIVIQKRRNGAGSSWVGG